MPNFSNPLTKSAPRAILEGSAQRSKRDPDAVPHWSKKINESSFGVYQVQITLDALKHEVSRIKRRIPGGAGTAGWVFQAPFVELDPTGFVPANTVVYISANNPLALGSYTDAVTSTIISSRPGLWVAKKNVPAAVSTTYNVPQLPYPGATGGSYGGHPYSGDLDGANVFWAFVSQSPNC